MILNFGKHKGIEIKDLADKDHNYFLWLFDQEWLNPAIKEEMKEYYELACEYQADEPCPICGIYGSDFCTCMYDIGS